MDSIPSVRALVKAGIEYTAAQPRKRHKCDTCGHSWHVGPQCPRCEFVRSEFPDVYLWTLDVVANAMVKLAASVNSDMSKAEDDGK